MQSYATTAKSICALCPTELTDKNKTKEHIIPNSIGGWEEVEGFICISCNRDKGGTWDAELASQLNWLAVKVGIVRDRGESPPEPVSTISGKQYLLQNNGRMIPASFIYEEISEDDKVKISFVARTYAEAVKKINEIAKRFPQIDKEKIRSGIEVQREYQSEPFLIQPVWGGPLAGRSVVNTALAFAFWKGIKPYACENVTNFLHDENPDSACYGLFYLIDIVKDRATKPIFHCVSIYGDTESRRLLAYVEYFGVVRWLIVLSNDYEGPSINEAYAIDPTTARTINIELLWPLTEQIIEQTVSGFGYTQESSEELNKAFGKIMYRSDERAYCDAIHIACENAAKKMGLKVGDQIITEHSPAFALIFMEELIPFLRFHIFDDLIDSAATGGIDDDHSPQTLKIASLIASSLTHYRGQYGNLPIRDILIALSLMTEKYFQARADEIETIASDMPQHKLSNT